MVSRALGAAKKAVLSMLAHKGEGRRVDVIEDLHRWHWEFTEPMPSLAEVWAIETADYPPLTLPPTDLQKPNQPVHFMPLDCDGDRFLE